ncbi:hypothetical protein C6497_12120 [Candidatus Poribacteria bacterium]|nr:MAG: hypothetical protein C6497_12120 [Candidatus Poribacteria bacterium]
MKIRYNLGIILCFLVFCTIACDKSPNPMKDTLSVSNDNAEPIDVIYLGKVVIGEMDKKYGVDPFRLNSAMIENDTMKVSVSYSGGCKPHEFTLVSSDVFLESDPVQLMVSIAHNANDDTCEAYPTEDYSFDLTPIKTMYQNAYGQDAGTIVIRLKDNPDGELVYKFDK